MAVASFLTLEWAAMGMARVTVFDGADCIGGNKIHLEFDGKGLFFDFGQNYKRMSEYYTDFLKPRSSRGIHDFFEMGLIPDIPQIRPDSISMDVDRSRQVKLRVDALFVSHAHMDHIGHAGFLDFNVPFVASPMTAAIMKAMKDCGQRGCESDCVYGQPRERDPEDGRIVKSVRMKKGDMYQGRNFLLTSPPSEELREFWEKSVYKYEIDAGEFLDRSFLDFDFRSFDVDHSIYGATAFAVETSEGHVVYTGDLRRHGRYRKRTDDFVKEAAALEPAALIIEGTRTTRGEAAAYVDEEVVKETCLEAVRDEGSLVIADFSPRNFERLDTFMEIAQETERSLVVTKKDAYYLQAIQKVDGRERIEGVRVFGALKAQESGVEEAACRCLDEVLDPRTIAESPEKYILCFSYFDIGNLLDIKRKGGTYVYSNSEAFNEEQVVDFRRLSNWLQLFRLKVKGFSMTGERGNEEPVFDRRYHASGHASLEDLVEVIGEIGAKKVIPVHTEDPMPLGHAGIRNLVTVVLGKSIEI
ncbi:MAG TPA: MBL fold metallo-hydrolase RNA specificity domain-containing protein [Methanomassiliicoccales archaeon]|nr:MBL fold metallo-hydrolase RNA specificity domain-containing protein [Methanomassiliicoccales archaeon]